MPLSKSQRAAVFAMFGGRCAYCGCVLPERGWHADHIEPVLREWWKKYHKPGEWQYIEGRMTWVEFPKPKVGLECPERDRIDNLFPACAPCNIDKSSLSLEHRRDGQEGICCTFFRNESAHLSSELIRQADRIADCLWPDRRHYTFVDAKAVRSRNPGYCFLCAGWRKAGMTKGGLLIFERDWECAA